VVWSCLPRLTWRILDIHTHSSRTYTCVLSSRTHRFFRFRCITNFLIVGRRIWIDFKKVELSKTPAQMYTISVPHFPSVLSLSLSRLLRLLTYSLILRPRCALPVNIVPICWDLWDFGRRKTRGNAGNQWFGPVENCGTKGRTKLWTNALLNYTRFLFGGVRLLPLFFFLSGELAVRSLRARFQSEPFEAILQTEKESEQTDGISRSSLSGGMLILFFGSSYSALYEVHAQCLSPLLISFCSDIRMIVAPKCNTAYEWWRKSF